ncbi:putative disease resistance protein RGA3-like isoform X1 [Hibiscus syriacus]|uniref:U-box domain-containing protein n=1 Tax=Hibiscus syriacus TaxID=106335 RepID=A0A6A2ZSW5_HIBSY|nr:putative disease resistance protein RGA3-like isoform X1 [Hibiscus syriacus]
MKEAQMAIPDLFRCPISLDLFSDPVTLSTGQTYDRSSIQKWFAYGNLTCPVSMQKLHDPSLVPNHNLRHLIQQWLQMSHRFDPDYSTTIDPLLDMKRCLESPQASLLEKLQILENIRVSMDETPSKIPLLLQIGLLPLVVQLLLGNSDPGFSEKLLSCILKLMSFGEFGSLNMLKEESMMESFVVLFENGTAMIKQSLCQFVGAISASSETRELCSMIGKNHRFLHRLVGLILHNSEMTEAGIEAVSALCRLESNREELVQQGLINGLVTYILNSETKERSSAARAMATMEQVLGMERGKEELIKDPGGVKAAVKMVFRVSDHEGSESALNSLIMVL